MLVLKPMMARTFILGNLQMFFKTIMYIWFIYNHIFIFIYIILWLRLPLGNYRNGNGMELLNASCYTHRKPGWTVPMTGWWFSTPLKNMRVRLFFSIYPKCSTYGHTYLQYWVIIGVNVDRYSSTMVRIWLYKNENIFQTTDQKQNSQCHQITVPR